MKVYECDSCKKVIENPYIEKIKEFDVGIDFNNEIYFLIDVRGKVKIHFCDECYKRLKSISQNKIMEEKK